MAELFEVVTFGCRLNIYESEVIKESAIQAGLENAIIFNSCAVTSDAERQLRQAIRKKRRENPSAKIIVTGCAAQLHPDKYLAMPEVNQIIGNEDKVKAKAYFQDASIVMVSDIMSIKETASHLVQAITGKARGFLQIQNGCNHRCTFCIIPFARGNNRSVPLGEIVTQIRILVANGYKEVVFTGVDITDYGKDLPGQPSLGQMIKRILSLVPELPRLRLSSIDVAEIDDTLLGLIASEPRLMPHLHLSLQSGDNLILKRMKRRHNREQIIDFCSKARQMRPDLVFGADIIAGFPTETEAMFNNTSNIIEEAGLTYLHVFPYSEREGTPAARMPQVAKQIRKNRAAKLRARGALQEQEFYLKQVNQVKQVLVEEEGIARAEDFSVVHLDASIPVNTILPIRVVKYEDNRLLAAPFSACPVPII